ncbi:MAG: cadherin repeat domain-containing protein [Arcobacteraceae bacterium]|nr:cadherin repeat domain-containing protein [Arcobacteraceae bacterium]
MKKNLLIVFFIFFLYGCGGGGASTSGSTDTTIITPTTPTITQPDVARFADAFTDGIEYRCGDTINGITGDTGESGGFKYKSDCVVEFSIGKIYLGDINGTLLKPELVVYPTNILGIATKDTNNSKVLNLARLLQSLDSDNNLTNGILVDSSTRTILSGITVNEFDLTKDSVVTSDLTNVLSKVFPTRTLKTTTEALNHLNSTLISEGFSFSSINPLTPYFIDPYTLQQKTYSQILSTHIKEKTFLLHGEPGTTVWVALSSDGSEPADVNFTNTNNLTIGADWKQYITLPFDNPNISTYHYFIKLKDNGGNFSNSLKIVISNDSIPPHVENTNIIEEVLEEQLLFRNVHATDAGGIKGYRVVSSTEDNRSKNDNLFTIDSNGTISFLQKPNFDDNIDAIFSVVTRAIDFAGNMTDLLLQVILKNLLDNPPALTGTEYSTSIFEALPNGTEVFNLSTILEHNLTKAPDNNPALSPIYYHLNNHTDIFDINKTTGIITIKNNTDSLFDFEQLPNTMDLNVSVENNNTYEFNDINTTYAKLTVNIVNKIDTTPKLIVPSTVLTIPEQSSNYLTNFPIGGILKDEPNSDRNLTMTFSISSGDSGNNFIVDPLTGIIYVNSTTSLDYETKKQYILTIRATNTWDDATHSTHYDEVNQTINITDVIDNSPSIVLKTVVNSIPESTNLGFTIATVDVNGTFFDANVTTSYTIDTVLKNGVALNPGLIPFTISNSGIVSTSRQLLNDYVESDLNTTDTVFKITIKALNQWWNGTSGASNPVVFDLNVSNVIDNPPTITITSNPIAFDENITLGTIIYDVNVSGSTYDTNMVTNYSIVSGNSENKFSIDATTGVVTLLNSLDWETTTSYFVGIKASNVDWNGTTRSSSTSNLTITVNNIIESPPSIGGPTTLDIHENIDIGELLDLIKINSTEEDKKTVDSITIVAGNSANKFVISSLKTDLVTDLKYVEFSLLNKLDYETTPNYTIDINATNIFGSSTHTININVEDDMEKDLPLLISMIEYNDINITTSTSDVYNKIFSNAVPVFGSLNDYFYRVSKTKFLFKKATETYSTSDGIIVTKLNKNHPQTDINRLTDDIKDALIDANNYVNFATYDKNNDGNISKDELQLLFLIAGGERTYGDTNLSITATSSSLDTNLTLDGKNIAFTGSGNFVVTGERNGLNDASIGLIAHHLANTALNFPYLNDRTNASYGIGYFGLMGYGYRGALDGTSNIGTTPVNPSAYSIVSQGWVYPRTIDRTTYNIEMVPSNKGVDGFNIIKIPTNDPTIYYLLENRIKTNLVGYDDGFYRMESTPFNGGLALWKINENYFNNDQVSTKLVDFVEYDGNTNINTKLSYGVSSALYHTGNPTYPSNLLLPFSITNSTIEASTNKMTIDIIFP